MLDSESGMQRETFFKIFFIAAFIGTGVLLFFGLKSLNPSKLALAYERAVPRLRKFGINVPNALDQSAGVCIPVVVRTGNDDLIEVENEPFPYATPLNLEYSESRAMPLCLFKVPDVGFTLSPDLTAVVIIYREPGKPAIVRLKSGIVSVASEKLEIIYRLPSLDLHLKSAKKTRLQISFSYSGSSVRILEGNVTAQITEVSKSRTPESNITFYSNEGARLSVNGSPAFSTELEAKWLPTGLNFNKTNVSPGAAPAPAKQ